MLKELAEQLRSQGLYVAELSDTKNRNLDKVFADEDGMQYGMLDDATCADNIDLACLDDLFAVYTYNSFVTLAAFERHRTLRCTFLVDNDNVYIPKILRGTAYATEWLTDMHSLNEMGILPQGTLVKTKMWGTVDDFLLMCKERLCGRAQLEIYEKVRGIYALLLASSESRGDTAMVSKLRRFGCSYNEETGKFCVTYTKCKDLKCSQPCMFIKNGLQNRIV